MAEAAAKLKIMTVFGTRPEAIKMAPVVMEMARHPEEIVPIVAVTANAFVEDRKTVMEAGMDGHLAKPYDLSQMMQTLGALLERGPRRTADPES